MRKQQEDTAWILGSTGTGMDRFIAEFQLTIGEDQIVIPERAYRDLSNVILPGSIYLMESGANVLIFMKGGDGDSAYDSRFIVQNRSLVRGEATGTMDWSDAQTLEFNR